MLGLSCVSPLLPVCGGFAERNGELDPHYIEYWCYSCMCVCTLHAWCTQKTEEGGDPLELEVWMVVGHHVGAGD